MKDDKQQDQDDGDDQDTFTQRGVRVVDPGPGPAIGSSPVREGSVWVIEAS